MFKPRFLLVYSDCYHGFLSVQSEVEQPGQRVYVENQYRLSIKHSTFIRSAELTIVRVLLYAVKTQLVFYGRVERGRDYI